MNIDWLAIEAATKSSSNYVAANHPPVMVCSGIMDSYFNRGSFHEKEPSTAMWGNMGAPGSVLSA
ncbi:MAG: hypothetical protein H6936_09465 [Burkholderiales bacterium]|nr:hypothetical protein [Nitrosomonas sp.]MCP5275061.1 hypothetical protein [Burkholderiales bacterium]